MQSSGISKVSVWVPSSDLSCPICMRSIFFSITLLAEAEQFLWKTTPREKHWAALCSGWKSKSPKRNDPMF